MDVFLTSDGLLALVTLAALEIVLGVDNLAFIAVVSGKLPASQQPRGRKVGLSLALVTRIALLLTISWMMGLTRPLFTVLGHLFSGRDLILLTDGLFLIAKTTWEIYGKVELAEHAREQTAGRTGFALVVAQIMVLDIVFSSDSVITAIGLASDVPVMVAAIVIAIEVRLSQPAPARQRHAPATRRRRISPDPARQQQPIPAGQRDELAGLIVWTRTGTSSGSSGC